MSFHVEVASAPEEQPDSDIWGNPAGLERVERERDGKTMDRWLGG